MRTRSVGTRWLFSGSMLLVALAQPAAIDMQSRSAAVERVIPFVPGQPLAGLLRANDKSVVVISDFPPPLMVDPPPGTSLVDWKTSNADYVVVIRVENKSSYLRPAGDWVMTTVQGDVLDVLKNSADRPLVGSVVFEEPGGQIELDGQQIQAKVPWVRPFEIGRTYLIFGTVGSGNELLVPAQDSYELKGRQLASQRSIPSMGKDSIEEAASADDVISAIRRKNRNPK